MDRLIRKFYCKIFGHLFIWQDCGYGYDCLYLESHRRESKYCRICHSEKPVSEDRRDESSAHNN